MGILEKMDVKKSWKAEFYRYNLTEKVEKTFYTELGAVLYGLYMGKYIRFRTRITNIA